MTNRKYRDEDWLYEQYVEKQLTQQQISEKVSVGQDTVSTWIRKFGIKKKRNDEKVLRELYVNKGLSSREIANKLECDKKTILNNLKKNGIAVKDSNEKKLPSYGLGSGGYFRWQHSIDGESNVVYEHRLLAVAEFGFEAVSDSVVHHQDHIQWNNQHSNLILFDSQSEHRKHHIEQSDQSVTQGQKPEI